MLTIIFIASLASSIPASHAEDQLITVKGRFLFHPNGSPYNSESIKGAKVEVWDAEPWPFPAELLATGSTDDLGNFEFEDISNDDGIIEGGRDVYVKVYAKNGAVDVQSNPYWLFGHTYSFQTETRNNVDPGTVNFGDVYTPSQDFGAWEIQNHLQIAQSFLESQTGLRIPRVRAFYKDAFSPAASYYYGGVLPAIGFIPSLPLGIAASELSGIHYSETNFIEGGQIRAHEVIYHEYGHYVQDYYADFWPPFTELLHDGHTAYNPDHAFVEGWAEYFSAAARQWAGFNETQYRDHPDVETNTEGDDVELSIAGVFWDIHDSEDESLDDISLGFYPIWRILTDYDPDTILSWPIGSDHPWDIYTFWELFKNNNAGDPSVGGVWKILKLHDIDIPDDVPPENPTTFTSPHEVGVGSQNDKVWVFWEGASDSLSGISNYAVCWTPSEYWDPTGDKPSPFGWDDYFDEYVTDNFASSPRLPPGDWWFHLKTKDNAGNWGEVVSYGPFTILEKISPITSLLTEAEVHVDYEGKLYLQQTDLLSLVVTDPFLKNPDRSYYRIAGGGYDSGSKEYNTSFRLNELSDGEYSFNYWTTSIFGDLYKEPMNLLQIVLDSAPPSTSYTIGSPIYSDSTTTYVDSITEIQLNAEDSASGVASTSYKIIGGSYDSGWITYSSPFTLTKYSRLEEGEYEVHYRSVDNVGNEENLNVISVYLKELGTHVDFAWSSTATNEGYPIYFKDLSESFPGSIVAWTWDFGDGTTTNLENPTHVYADDGCYEVVLHVTDDTASTYSIIYEVYVGNLAPEVNFDSDLAIDEGAPSIILAIFNDRGSLDNHTSMIDWGDESPLDIGVVSEIPYGPPGSTAGMNGTVDGTHVYGDDGIYTVTVAVTDDDGGVAEDTLTVNVNNVPPTVDAGLDQTVMINQPVNFIGQSTDPGSDDLIFTWEWGDGSPDTVYTFYNNGVGPDPYPSSGPTYPVEINNPVTHTYSTIGAYTVKLSVTDDDGATTTDTLSVLVLPPSDITTGKLCPNFDTESETLGNQFRIIYTPDVGNDSSLYKIAATNPGQFTYNVFYLGNLERDDSFTITIPEFFTTQGANPIQVYDNVNLIDGCYVPGTEITDEFTVTSPSADTLSIISNGPHSGVIYITLHLEYALKQTTGYEPQPYNVLDLLKAHAKIDDEVIVEDLTSYIFSVSGKVSDSQEMQSRNVFKKIRGIIGFIEGASEGDSVDITGPIWTVTVLVDEDGFFGYSFHHTGKVFNYIVDPMDYDAVIVQIKAGRLAEVNFP